MRSATRAWGELIGLARGGFTRPGFEVFETLLAGWVLAPGRRTLTAMIAAADPAGRRAHDAYHRFVRAGRWSTTALWRALVVVVVERLCPTGPVPLDLDDTLYKKTGRMVDGAGIFRDAVRSTRSKVVCALGLNLVVVTLRVSPPWGGCPLALPVSMRLHRKDGASTIELAREMVTELAGWLPERNFSLCADGAYATLCGRGLARTTVTSRMRRDAALYEAAPPPTGKRGRPRTRGARLPTPAQWAKELDDTDFSKVDVDWRGRPAALLVWSKKVLWYSVDKSNLVTLVIVRDPEGHQPDDFFVTTDADATPGKVASRYAGRWSIECMNRDVKQVLGAEDPQCWKGQGPERAAALLLWLYSAVWAWYLGAFATKATWLSRPWYPKKAAPSFIDALAALRRCLWTQRITPLSSSGPINPKIIDGMLDVLTHAA
jgi:hypothetical protein